MPARTSDEPNLVVIAIHDLTGGYGKVETSMHTVREFTRRTDAACVLPRFPVYPMRSQGAMIKLALTASTTSYL